MNHWKDSLTCCSHMSVCSEMRQQTAFKMLVRWKDTLPESFLVFCYTWAHLLCEKNTLPMSKTCNFHSRKDRNKEFLVPCPCIEVIIFSVGPHPSGRDIIKSTLWDCQYMTVLFFLLSLTCNSPLRLWWCAQANDWNAVYILGFPFRHRSRISWWILNLALFHDYIWSESLSVNEAPSLTRLQVAKLRHRSLSVGASQSPYPALTRVCIVSLCLRSECHIRLIMRTSWRHTPADWPSPVQTDSPSTHHLTLYPEDCRHLSPSLTFAELCFLNKSLIQMLVLKPFHQPALL